MVQQLWRLISPGQWEEQMGRMSDYAIGLQEAEVLAARRVHDTQQVTVVRLPVADCSGGFKWDGVDPVDGMNPIDFEERWSGWTLRRKS
jgi:hypothetical protein